jgi:hypothetical protein
VTSQEKRQRLSKALRDLSDELDVPPSKYQEAKDRYEAVGAWLGDDESELAPFSPTISPQGSFGLGTTVRPVGDGDYDVDSVCLLESPPTGISQEQLKGIVGDRLKHPKSRYKGMVDPSEGGRRCWTIKYADASKFHLDVLPAVPDDPRWLIGLGVPEELAETAIRITDRTTWNREAEWPRSNPKGFAAWFKGRMGEAFEDARRALALEKSADVEGIEDFEVRTPLQRVIQILKRHRDLRFAGDEDEPVSILITTLAAHAYEGEHDLADAILNVVPRMRDFVEQRDGLFWVANPVNPKENFADKWAEKPRKAEVFFAWLASLEAELEELLTDTGWTELGAYLVDAFGERDAATTMGKIAARAARERATGLGAAAVITQRKSEEAPRPKVELPRKPARPWNP